MLRRTLLAAALAAGFSAPALAQTEIKISTFSGSTNVVTWVAIEKGFFAKEGLKASSERTHGSKEQQQDLMAGKYQFASTSRRPEEIHRSELPKRGGGKKVTLPKTR